MQRLLEAEGLEQLGAQLGRVRALGDTLDDAREQGRVGHARDLRGARLARLGGADLAQRRGAHFLKLDREGRKIFGRLPPQL